MAALRAALLAASRAEPLADWWGIEMVDHLVALMVDMKVGMMVAVWAVL